jgi:hypothetical protein
MGMPDPEVFVQMMIENHKYEKEARLALEKAIDAHNKIGELHNQMGDAIKSFLEFSMKAEQVKNTLAEQFVKNKREKPH